jgi:hypothetical protein
MADLNLELHNLFNGLKRYSYPFKQQLGSVPKNGIYIKFEVGEYYNSLDRIVRIGSDKGENQLHSRLFQHFENENQRRSIFRKNIGRCLLAKTKDEYLKYWDLRFTSQLDKEKNRKFVDLNYETKIEKEVSKFIQKNISFCVFEVKDKEERLFWETKIIATIARSNIKPSSTWLGNYCPKEQVKISGLWQVQGLNKPQLTNSEFEKLKRIIAG